MGIHINTKHDGISYELKVSENIFTVKALDRSRSYVMWMISPLKPCGDGHHFTCQQPAF